MLDTSLSYRDTSLLFMLLDCNTVSERGLKKSAKKLAPLYEQARAQQMNENINKLKEVVSHQEDPPHIDLGIDTAHNNPIKGRAFSQPGTSSPVVEYTTKRRMKFIWELKINSVATFLPVRAYVIKDIQNVV